MSTSSRMHHGETNNRKHESAIKRYGGQKSNRSSKEEDRRKEVRQTDNG